VTPRAHEESSDPEFRRAAAPSAASFAVDAERMMFRAWTILASALLLTFVGCSTKDGGKLHWERDPEKGIERAQMTGRPMLLYFTSDG
jgi:hypothetical protein